MPRWHIIIFITLSTRRPRDCGIPGHGKPQETAHLQFHTDAYTNYFVKLKHMSIRENFFSRKIKQSQQEGEEWEKNEENHWA